METIRGGKQMSIEKFDNGAVLITGDDLAAHFEKMLNRRDNYDKSCSFFAFKYGESDECDGCSISSIDRGCSCHINPPCSYCVDSHFEPSAYLINYKRYSEGGQGRWRWECFRAEKEVFEKLNSLENEGYYLTAEVLTTGECSLCISWADDDADIEICLKKDFKETMCKLIMRFDHDEYKKSIQ